MHHSIMNSTKKWRCHIKMILETKQLKNLYFNNIKHFKTDEEKQAVEKFLHLIDFKQNEFEKEFNR